MKPPWWWWVVALSPALAGAVSVALELGDFRTSGLIAGVSVSVGLIAILLLLRARWRGKHGLRRWASAVPGLLLGMISLLGLSEGLPEFFQARGLFVDLGSMGPVKVLAYTDGALIVGNDGEGGFIWVSEDGSNWTLIDDEALSDLILVDGVTHGPTTFVIGRSTNPTDAVLLASEDGGRFEEHGRFSNRDHGTAPDAVALFRDGLVAITDIIGNDVEFYRSADFRTWTPGQPSPVFDDGESGRDIACSGDACVGVGFLEATYRDDLTADTGVAWISTTGDDFRPVAFKFDTDALDAVAWTPSGFLAVANDPAGQGIAWHSTDGATWRSLSGPFNEMIVDGVEAVDDAHIVLGHDPTSGELIMWRSEDAMDWTESVVATDLPDGSELRSVAGMAAGLIAVGIDAETFDILVWISPDGDSWQQAASIPAR